MAGAIRVADAQAIIHQIVQLLQVASYIARWLASSIIFLH